MSVIVSLLGTVLGTMLGTAATTRQAEDINCSNAGRVCTPLLTSATCCFSIDFVSGDLWSGVVPIKLKMILS